MSSSPESELICFLDSDDYLTPNYLAEVTSFYSNHPQCEFLYFNYEKFSLITEIVTPKHTNQVLGQSVILTALSQAALGNVMTLAITKSILAKIFPLECKADWKTEADTVLTWSCSLAGARKYYLPKVLYRRRIHGNNDSLNKPIDLQKENKIKLIYRSTSYFIVIKIDSSGQRRGERTGDKRAQRQKKHLFVCGVF